MPAPSAAQHSVSLYLCMTSLPSQMLGSKQGIPKSVVSNLINAYTRRSPKTENL
jgi:hypothetical protein